MKMKKIIMRNKSLDFKEKGIFSYCLRDPRDQKAIKITKKKKIIVENLN